MNTHKSKQQNSYRKVSLGSIPDFTHQGKGYRLDGVLPNSPAAIAGLHQGDVIIKIDDTGLRDMSAVLKTLQAGQKITIRYQRHGHNASTEAILKEK